VCWQLVGSEDRCHSGCGLWFQVDETRAKLRAETAAAQETTQEAASQLAEQEAALAAAKEQQEGCQRQLKSLARERKDALQAKAAVEADVNEAAAALEAGRQGLRTHGCLMSCTQPVGAWTQHTVLTVVSVFLAASMSDRYVGRAPGSFSFSAPSAFLHNHGVCVS